MQAFGLERRTQGLAWAQQVRLADDVVKGAWAQPLSERSVGTGGRRLSRTGLSFEERLLIGHAPSLAASRRRRANALEALTRA